MIASRESIEEAWFDPVAIFESDCDEDFHSAPDGKFLKFQSHVHSFSCSDLLDVFILELLKLLLFAEMPSLNGFDGVSVSSNSSVKDSNCGEYNDNGLHTSSTDRTHKPGDLSTENSANNSVTVVSQRSNVQIMNVNDVDTQTKFNDHSVIEANEPVFLDEISSSVDETSAKEEGMLDNCGILPSTCLPCLASTVPSVEKRRSLISSPPSARKKAALKLPFKWKEQANASLCKNQNCL